MVNYKKNKSYWDNFYKTNTPPITPSDFAKFVAKDTSSDMSLVDVGCGNGRDTQYFDSIGYDAIGLDLSNPSNFLGKNFTQSNVVKDPLPNKNIYYCRFFIHSLNEEDTDIFLKKLSKIPSLSALYIETRSTKGIDNNKLKLETNFKSPIGEKHFRMLYSTEYIFNKISNLFYIPYIEESNQFSIYKNESPYLIRIKALKK